jgi:hypothetical protein
VSNRPIGVLTLVAAFTLNLTANTALAAADAVAPRFYDSEKPIYKRSKDKLEITTKYQDSAFAIASMYKSMIERNKHKGSFHTDKRTFYIDDLTAKKSFVVTSRLSVRKKFSPTSYTALEAMFPNNPELLAELQNVYDKQGDWVKAHEVFGKLRALDAKKEAERNEALIFSQDSLGHHMNTFENATDAYYVLQMGHYDTAIKMLNALIEKHPDSLLNYKNRALAYRKLKKDDLALKDEQKIAELQKARLAEGPDKHFERVKRQHPADYLKSKTALGFGIYEQAIAEADKELAANPNAVISMAVKADAEAKLGRYSAALADYKKVEVKAPKAARIKTDIADMTTLAAKGAAPYGDLKLLEPTEERKQAQARHPGMKTAMDVARDHKGDYRVYHAIAEALRDQGRWPERKAELDKMYAVAPISRNLLFEEIEATQALGRWPETEKYCDTYINLLANGDVPGTDLEAIEYVLMIRALARQAQKNYTGAIADDSLALKVDPTSAVLLKDRAACYEKSNKPDLAKADLAAAGKSATPD